MQAIEPPLAVEAEEDGGLERLRTSAACSGQRQDSRRDRRVPSEMMYLTSRAARARMELVHWNWWRYEFVRVYEQSFLRTERYSQSRRTRRGPEQLAAVDIQRI